MPAGPIPLEEVIANEALERRAVRAREAGAEERAMQSLREALAGSPRNVLQRFAEMVLGLCLAHSAGVCLSEEADGVRQFRWCAMAGEWRDLLWTTLPGDVSPGGAALERSAPQLMIDPERHFTSLAQVRPRVAEALLAPFVVRGVAVGTVWVVAHDDSRQFDREDQRQLWNLTQFAAAAYERLASMRPEDLEELIRMRAGPPGADLPPDDRD